MKKKTILSIVALLIVVLAIFGITKFVGAEGKGGGETVVVTHDSGETTVNKNSKRIVVFDFGILDSLDKLNVQGIVGVVQNGLPEHLSKFAGEEYSSVGSLKEPNMEKIFELNPDLIIISGRQADYYEELSKIAPTINLSIDNKNYLESFEKNMNVLGKIFDKENEVKEELTTIKEAISKLNSKATEKNITGLIHGQKASFEYVLEKNPDYLFVVDRAAIAGGTISAKELFDNELMKKTDAYKNGNIIYLNPSIWYTATGGFTSTMKMVEEIDSAIK